ncbi:hypothetical protein BDV98DRAFT_406584 [Pterulicium gracile]|uniref:Uncharacterized protein n=1 Tax=Pterulicium gracile TaxID=1884261 RepID=A0A5C3QM58_9AGAR|nr:hypothetical protein BDV98DRAFT_406584 [Pterula gracilis]
MHMSLLLHLPKVPCNCTCCVPIIAFHVFSISASYFSTSSFSLFIYCRCLLPPSFLHVSCFCALIFTLFLCLQCAFHHDHSSFTFPPTTLCIYSINLIARIPLLDLSFFLLSIISSFLPSLFVSYFSLRYSLFDHCICYCMMMNHSESVMCPCNDCLFLSNLSFSPNSFLPVHATYVS